MLQIQDIRKQYITGDLVQTALDGVSLTLRDNEFVAILGPSGSGKTTLLNVIGGLDRYDSGDLIINGISTKEYTDRDWDSYRNHTIGFVFQSYNLIPHQSVLSNVELALTISGISRSERRRRAKEALEAVGLGNQLHKRPNQMSGGQMQRVAIARALVNDPDILLADEPTGALDSETSVQVMDLLKEVAENKLVVMVTHNPELAEQYANRIVRVKDGRITGDTNPYLADTAPVPPHYENMGKASMSHLTALSLSFNNLWTKKARTLLTSFAGSIGIIGIALIISLSTGFQRYIDKIQEDTLSNYPLTIQSETADMTAALAAFGASAAQMEENRQDGVVQEQQMITQMFGQIGSNDLSSFKAHLDEQMSRIGHTLNAVTYRYGIKPQIYAADTTDGVMQVNPSSLFGDLTGNAMMSAYMDSDIFYEMMGNIELLEAQYDVLQGRWPQFYDEMILVLQDPNQLSDYTAYALGMRDPGELETMIGQIMAGEEPQELNTTPMQWTYDELMALEFRLVNAPDRYRYNSEYKVWEDMSGDKSHMQALVEQGLPLKIVGIVAPKEGVSTTALSSGIAYTADLTRYVIDEAAKSDIVAQQLADNKTDVFTGKAFGAREENSELKFEDMISVDADAISSAFGMNISEKAIAAMLENYLSKALASIDVDTAPAQAAFLDGLSALSSGMLNQFIGQNADQTGAAMLYLTQAQTIADSYLAGSEAQSVMADLSGRYGVPQETLRQVYQPLLTGLISYHVASQIAGGENLIPSQPPAPEQTLPPETTAPQETLPTETTAPQETVPPETTAPQETVPPETTVPQETLPPETTVPQETVPPETTVPQETLPAQTTGAPGEGQAAVVVLTQPAPEEIIPEVTIPELTLPQEILPDGTLPPVTIDPGQICAPITSDQVEAAVAQYLQSPVVTGAAGVMSAQMMQETIMDQVSSKIAGMGNVLMRYMGSAISVDEEKLSSAFQFNMDQEELARLMAAMSTPGKEATVDANLRSLGYADADKPSSMSVYFVDFEGKEEFLAFLDSYNADMEAAGKEDQVIGYTDMTGIMMRSVRTIIDSVSYALIAFVAVSLAVSSIMIGIITYISVMERTKEIGVLRAIGASKRNISQVFNAETFIIGLCSGLIGVGVTLLVLLPGNELIYHLTKNPDIVAQLPVASALVLIGLSVILTLIGGFIPAKQAAKKDPVIALRSE